MKPSTTPPPDGPYISGSGFLCYRDGNTMFVCECIKGPYAERVVALFEKAKGIASETRLTPTQRVDECVAQLFVNGKDEHRAMETLARQLALELERTQRHILSMEKVVEREESLRSSASALSEDFVIGQLDKDIADAIDGLPAIWRPGFKERFSRLLRKAIKLCAAPRSATSFWAEAANAVLEVRDGEVMSKHATAEECRAARDALWKAAEALQNRADSRREDA